MIGRNGSGKTVLFKCICGFLRVDDGAVFVDGKQIGKEIEAPESIGAIIETPGFLPGYSARQNLQFLAGIRRKIGKRRSMRLSEKSDWIRKRKSMSASIRSACASVSALHRRLWKNLPS